jgi:hypothetical protein
MPLMKYVVFVGSALVLSLLAMNWLPPDTTTEPVYSRIERPVIRISSIETLPERVVFDTSRPYMTPPSSVVRGAAQPLQSAFTFEKMTPSLLPAFSTLAPATPKPITEKGDPAKHTARRDPAKKVIANRAAPQPPIAPQPHIAALKNYPAGEAGRDTKPPVKTAELDAEPLAKPTLLDDIAGRFGQIFKMN